MNQKEILGKFLLWWAAVAGTVMGISVATFALAGTVYHPTQSSWAAWATSSALAAVFIVIIQNWRLGNKMKREKDVQSQAGR